MIYEKLYLDKPNEVFVDERTTVKLTQYQKDGLRSLYLQYAKNRPGYILNDPPNAGKHTQLAVFLNAIKPVLEQPVFIICNNVDKWRDTFSSWTNDLADIIFESNKLFSDKKIFVSSLDTAVAISRREWSIIVVDDSECPARLFKQLKGLKAGFKIVLTSVDLKNNYKTFSTIYEWINAKEKAEMEKVSRQVQGMTRALDQAILLDFHFHDKVLCRNDAGGFTENVFQNQPKVRAKLPPPTKQAPKKNKDVTGTKVKRSKPKPVEESINDAPSDSSRFEFDTMSAPYTSKVEYESREMDCAIDKPCDGIEKRTDNNESNVFETDSIKGTKRKYARILESDDENGNSANSGNPNKETKIGCRNETVTNEETKESDFMNGNMNYEMETPEDNLVSVNKLDSEQLQEIVVGVEEEDIVPATEQDQRNIVKLDNAKISSICKEESVSRPNHNELMQISPDLFSNNEIDKVASESSRMSTTANHFETLIGDNIGAKKSASITDDSDSETIITNGKYKLEKCDKKNEIKIDEINKSCEINTNEKTALEYTCSQTKSSKFDDKIKDLQEKTINKFKGSILDCLF